MKGAQLHSSTHGRGAQPSIGHRRAFFPFQPVVPPPPAHSPVSGSRLWESHPTPGNSSHIEAFTILTTSPTILSPFPRPFFDRFSPPRRSTRPASTPAHLTIG
jgi:hypothetical protein